MLDHGTQPLHHVVGSLLGITGAQAAAVQALLLQGIEHKARFAQPLQLVVQKVAHQWPAMKLVPYRSAGTAAHSGTAAGGCIGVGVRGQDFIFGLAGVEDQAVAGAGHGPCQRGEAGHAPVAVKLPVVVRRCSQRRWCSVRLQAGAGHRQAQRVQRLQLHV